MLLYKCKTKDYLRHPQGRMSAVVLHVSHLFNIIIACLGYLPTLLQLDSIVHTIVVAASNKSTISGHLITKSKHFSPRRVQPVISQSPSSHVTLHISVAAVG